MAQLPPDGEWLIQHIGGQVILFHRHTEEEVVRFDPTNPSSCARAQRTISESTKLDAEQKCFAHFWSGYFYAHASEVRIRRGTAWLEEWIEVEPPEQATAEQHY